MQPRNENNFLIEITPEVMRELNQLYLRADESPVIELHYSPYWKDMRGLHNKNPELLNNTSEKGE